MPSHYTGRPYDFVDEDSMKIIVLMTDGSHFTEERVNAGYRSGLSNLWKSTGDGNYSAYHPGYTGSSNKYFVPHRNEWRSAPWNSGSGVVQQTWPQVWTAMRMSYVAWHLYGRGLGSNSSLRQQSYRDTIAAFRSLTATTTMDSQLQSACTMAKNNGVIVYGIAFEAPTAGAAADFRLRLVLVPLLQRDRLADQHRVSRHRQQHQSVEVDPMTAFLSRLLRGFRKEDGNGHDRVRDPDPDAADHLHGQLRKRHDVVRSILLEQSVDRTMRSLRLGHYPNPTADILKAEICEKTVIFADCTNNIMIEMQRVSTSTWTMPSTPITCVNREEDVQPVLTLQIGQQQDVMLVRVCIVQDLLFPTTGFGLGLPQDSQGGVGLVAETAFVTEPA